MNIDRKNIVIGVLVLGIAFLGYLRFDDTAVRDAYKLEKERDLKALKDSRDSLKFARRELVAEKILAIKEMQKVTQEGNNKVAQAEKLIHELKSVKIIHTRNTSERDSLLQSVIKRYDLQHPN